MNPEINVIELINGFEKFSSGKLKEPDDIRKLIELCSTNVKYEQLQELAFTAKYVQGLFRIAESATNNNEITNAEEIKKELAINVEKCTRLFNSLITEEELQPNFTTKYLSLTAESFTNFKNILSDFEWLKIYFNELKRN